MRSNGPSSQPERVNGRNKPCRRRNISTPNIGLSNGAGDRNAGSGLRSYSSSNLRNGRNRLTPDGHRRRFSMSIEEECAADYASYSQMSDAQAGPGAGSQLTAFPASAYDKHAASIAAGLASSAGHASRAASVPQQLNLAAFTQLPPGLEQPMQQQNGAQQMLQQHTPSMQLPAVAGSSPRSHASSSSIGLQETGSNMAALSVRLAAPHDPSKCSTPISPAALQTFYGPDILQPVGASVDVLPPVGSSSDICPLLLAINSSTSTPGLAEMPAAAAAAAPASNSSTSVPPAAAAAGSPHIFSQVSLSTWAVPEVPAVAAAATATEHVSFDTVSSDVEDSEELIQKRIEELLLQKQLLKLRQQHKQQQALLQLQQQQQEQAIQQQLQLMQRGQHKLPQKQNNEPLLQQQQQVQPNNASFTSMQSAQEQQQVLQVQLSNGSFTNMQPLQQQQQQQQHVLQVQASGGSFTSLQNLQQNLQPSQVLTVQSSGGSLTGLPNLQQQQQQQQQRGMLGGQQGDTGSSSAAEKSPEQLQREMLQLQLQQLQLQQQLLQQQQGSVAATPSSYVLLQGALGASQPLTSAGLMINAGSGPACSTMMTQLQPNPNSNPNADPNLNPSGMLSASSSSALSAFACRASAALQDDVMPVLGVGDGGSYTGFDTSMSNGAAAGAGAGLASWGSGQQLNLGGAVPSYNVLFGDGSGQGAVTDSVISVQEGAWSFDAGLSFPNQ
jgi:hypothetical protein